MKDPLGISPSRGNQGTTRGKEKILLTSVGIEPTTYGIDLPLLTLWCLVISDLSREKRVHICTLLYPLPLPKQRASVTERVGYTP